MKTNLVSALCLKQRIFRNKKIHKQDQLKSTLTTTFTGEKNCSGANSAPCRHPTRKVGKDVRRKTPISEKIN